MTPDERPSVLVLQHGELAPPGILGTWLDDRGMRAVLHHAGDSGPLPEPDEFAFVASLGWARSPRDLEDPLVAEELDLIRTCVDRDVPVLGLCFGGQALAAVLGGTVAPLDTPERGWQRIETDVPEIVAEGPWLQWHYDAFTTPPGAEELARSAACPQAFRLGPHLGVQFHPETTPEIVAEWARFDQARLPEGLDHHLDRMRLDARHASAAARAAVRLFDAFWAGAARPDAPARALGRR